jgi:hypothetical protein
MRLALNASSSRRRNEYQGEIQNKKERDLLACPAVQFILLALIRMMYLGRIGCSCIILLGSKDFMGSCS